MRLKYQREGVYLKTPSYFHSQGDEEPTKPKSFNTPNLMTAEGNIKQKLHEAIQKVRFPLYYLRLIIHFLGFKGLKEIFDRQS